METGAQIPLELKPKIDLCLHYEESPGVREIMTVVLAPIRIRDQGDGQFIVGWGCSHAGTCHSEKCYYALTKRHSQTHNYGEDEF